MMPLISVVSGTFNRLESLIRMVRSARDNIPAGIPYELILVDGGSTDGSLQWAKAQTDCIVIEHGALLGAIRAFTDGATRARGKYVILANDDVEFLPGSILAALVHLDTHPDCGAVAFMDNRPVPGREPGAFRAQTMPALRDGQGTQVVYAQVGMFRLELGDIIGWWGADDPIMKNERTYGGDNWLSARIWEMGYSADVVKEALVADYHINDVLRETNANTNHSYHKAFPHGPSIASAPYRISPVHENLRILYMPVFEPDHDHHRFTKRGLYQALARRATVWEWNYLDERAGAMAECLQTFEPHLILTQFHDGRRADLLGQLRQLCPRALIINWCGDARGLTERVYLDMLKSVDLQLVVNASSLSIYAQEGIPAAYWQIGYEPRLGIESGNFGILHDVVFQGTCYNEARKTLERNLRATPLRVGLYGAGWLKSDGNSLYNFNEMDAIYKSSKIAIGDAFNDGKTECYGFVSNRFFEALASGAFLLQQSVPGLDQINGVRAGEHYVEWTDMSDLLRKIDQYLRADGERARIAEAGHAFVTEHFSFDAQVEKLFRELLPIAQKASVA